MTAFLLEVRVEPADEYHCEDSGKRCPQLSAAGAPKCTAFPTAEIKRDWARDAYACALRCSECIAAENEATDAA